MQRLKLPLASISIINRQRQELGDIDDLAESMRHYGLIQPIIVSQDHRLIAGERRFRAAEKLGWQEIDIVYRETLTEDELHELELIENTKRLDMSWQERCLNIATIHRLKVQRNALEGESWGYRETGELLGMFLGNINNCLVVAKELRQNKESPMWHCETLTDALRIILGRKEDLANAILAQKAKELANRAALEAVEATAIATIDSSEDLLAEERRRYYNNPLNPSGSFETYWSEKVRLADESQRTIYLSNRLFCGDACTFMSDRSGEFDHIITDAPYAIDMDMLDQENLGMADIDSVADEHDVESNKALFLRFFPAAYAAMKPSGFLITWCDQMLWAFLYNAAIAAGFSVQRWPITWVKSHTCMNSAASFNFTKTTEIAMVCRKGTAVLAQPTTTSHIVASHDDFKKAIGHPFVKPFRVWEFLLDATTHPGQTILDPFAGRGSSIISFIRKERNFLAAEINVTHFNALMENVKQHYLTLNPRFIFK